MRFARRLISIVTIAFVCWRFPPFRVVPLKRITAGKVAETFNAKRFAEAFWTNQLPGSLEKAVKSEVLLPAIQSDAASAKKRFGRTVGLSEGYFYFISGSGRVTAASDDEVSLAMAEGKTDAEISLQTGLIFGNALRDGTGLLNAGDYPNSQDFNDISTALNHIVETTVLPKLRQQAKVGARISFVGCAEISDEASDLKPLKVIPIQTESE
jgi:predicted lipoprotein